MGRFHVAYIVKFFYVSRTFELTALVALFFLRRDLHSIETLLMRIKPAKEDRMTNRRMLHIVINLFLSGLISFMTRLLRYIVAS